MTPESQPEHAETAIQPGDRPADIARTNDAPVEDAPRRPSLLGRVTGAALNVAAGAAAATAGLVDQGLSAAWEINKGAVKAAGAVAGAVAAPLDALGVTDLVAQPVQAVTGRVADTVAGLEARGRAGLADGANALLAGTGLTLVAVVNTVLDLLKDNEQVQTLIRAQLDWLLPALAEHPALQALVRAQVAALLPELAADAAVTALVRAQVAALLPELARDPAITALALAQVAAVLPALDDNQAVQALIRAQGDRYVEYLNAHPTAVQSLVQGQSLTLANQVREEVRERTVTADSFVDIVVRNILRLPPREQQPPPPPDVRRRADSARLPSDFTARTPPEPDNA